MATRRTRAVKAAQVQAQAIQEPIQAQAIQEPGLCEEVMGELEHGGKIVEDLAVALDVTVNEIIRALEVLLAEGSVEMELPPVIFHIAKGGAR